MMAQATGILIDIALSSAGTDFDENSVTPGVAGFIAIFLIAAVTILLLLDMTRRVRRARYRGEIAERLDAEEAAAKDATTSSTVPGADDAPTPGDPRGPLR